MLKKLIPLSLSLLICLSLLPGRAGAMEVMENGQPIQAENVGENNGSGIAPCMAHPQIIWGPGEGGGGIPFPVPGGPGSGAGSAGGR